MTGEGTEEIISALRSFFTGTYSDTLEQYADSDTPMNRITEDCIAMGGADLSRYENKKITVVIIPEREGEADRSLIGDTAVTSGITISFLCRGYAHEVLLRQMCRYTAALRKSINADSTFGGLVSECSAGSTDFFPNAGSVDRQMAAAETDITVTVRKNTDSDNDFEDIFI